MANVVSGNSASIDSNGTITTKLTVVSHIFVQATAASAVIEFQDDTTNSKKLRVELPTDGDTKQIDLQTAPLVFNTGVEVANLANCEATIRFREVKA